MNTIDQQLHSISPEEAIRLIASTKGESERKTLDASSRALDIARHSVNDPLLRRDKRVRINIDPSQELSPELTNINIDPTSGEGTATRIDRVNRIALAIQKRILNTSVAFTFGNPTLYNASPRDEAQTQALQAFRSVLDGVRIDSHDRRMARTLFGFTEVAELWYTVDDTEQSPAKGYTSALKLRVQLLSPERGQELIPMWDEYGDLTAFARRYNRYNADTKQDEAITECYTAEYLYKWANAKPIEGYPRPNPLGKIPIVYAKQQQHETADVDALIARLETLLSNFSDTNDYHASPKIFVTGDLHGFSQKGEAGAIIEGAEGSRAEYLSWNNAPEAVRLEIQTLISMIYSISQTPDISFESVKGLGALSGTAIKMLFMDAHLKVQTKREVLDEYLLRRCSIIKAYLSRIASDLSPEAVLSLAIKPEITPYIITSEQDELNYWLSASGGKALISHGEAIERAGLSLNPTETLKALQEESKATTLSLETEDTDL